MDVVPEVITHAEPTKLMKPTNRSFYYPAIHAQATPMRRTPLGQLWVDAAVAQFLSFLLVVKTPVAQDFVWTLTWMSRLPSDGRYGLHQRHGLVGVRRI